MCAIGKEIYNDRIERVTTDLPFWPQSKGTGIIGFAKYGFHLGRRHPPADHFESRQQNTLAVVHVSQRGWTGVHGRTNGDDGAKHKKAHHKE